VAKTLGPASISFIGKFVLSFYSIVQPAHIDSIPQCYKLTGQYAIMTLVTNRDREGFTVYPS
jgi:hypothetical protein